MMWIAYVLGFIALVCLLPALAFAGWRAGRRSSTPTTARPTKPTSRSLSMGSAQVHPRVRTASYKRSEGRK